MARYLVKWEGRPKSDNSWTKHHWFRSTGNEDVFEELYAKFDLESKTAFNMQLEPILHNPNLRINESDASGVVALSVSAEDARRCADHLKAEWKNGKLKMSDKSVARGYKTYGKTLLEQNAEEQGLNTLLITQQLLPAVRQNVPGFHAMEKQLASWLQAKFGTVVELYYAHGLRQGPLTLRSSGFSVHQDTEDYDFIEYTIVVKLTADEPGEAPSAMRVVGADRHFHYGAKHGDAGCFRARLYHASVEPTSEREHLKIAFFYKKSVQGERLARRGVAARGEVDEQEVQRRREEIHERAYMNDPEQRLAV